MMKPNKISNSIYPGRAGLLLCRDSGFQSISSRSDLLRLTPYIVIPVLGLSLQENYQGWGSKTRIYLFRKLSIN